MADGEMRRIVLKLIKDEPSNKPEHKGSGKQLAIVQWAKNDKSISVQLIRADYWINVNDGQTYFKAKGLSHADLMAVFGPGANGGPSLWVREKIGDLMKNPPAVKPAAKPDTSGASDDLEEVPF